MQGPFNQSFQPLADLKLDFIDTTVVTGYHRDLNISKSISTVSYVQNGISYKRECFISYPDNVLVLKISADRKASVSLKLSMDSQVLHKNLIQEQYLVQKCKAPKHVEPNYRQNLPPDQTVIYDDWDGEGMEAETWVKVVSKGGKVINGSDSVSFQIENADELLLLLSSATSFNGRFKSPGLDGINPSEELRACFTRIAGKSYADLKASHIKDYTSLFDRVNLTIGDEMDNPLPTDQRIINFARDRDPNMVSLLFQYGRYLLISSSREGGQPANLQGIWNNQIRPPWSSNYTMNINAEMNYWPAEVCNLSETTGPMFGLIKDLAVNGKITAKVNYNLDGWCCHHNTDIWAQTAPVGDYGEGDPVWANWYNGGAWICSMINEHYLYSGDSVFLMAYYPILKGAARFNMGLLTQNKQGYLEPAFGFSPENTYSLDGKTLAISAGTAMDLGITRDLLISCREAANTLNIDAGFALQLDSILGRLQPYRISKENRLQEWSGDFEETDPLHRHISHLFALHPGNQINIWDTPELFEAAKNSLTRRGMKLPVGPWDGKSFCGPVCSMAIMHLQ